jgi:hypothetical protein
MDSNIEGNAALEYIDSPADTARHVANKEIDGGAAFERKAALFDDERKKCE